MEHLNFEDQIYQTTHSYYTLELKQKDNPPYYTTTKVDVSHLAQGHYVLVLANDEGKIAKEKLIIEECVPQLDAERSHTKKYWAHALIMTKMPVILMSEARKNPPDIYLYQPS